MCHQTFSSLSAFDKHRDGSHSQATRHCLEPVAAGLVDARRNYPCWSLPGSDIPWFSDNEES